MNEGTTCYERDETLCEDQMCLRTGCRIANQRHVERQALATMVYEAVRFANWAAGEGFSPVAGEPALDPGDFLSDFVNAIGGDDYDGLPELARDAVLNTAALEGSVAVPADEEWFLRNDPVHVEIEGPFKRDHDRWPCFTLSAPDRVVAAVFYVDGNSERARSEAELIRAVLRLGEMAIERAHYAEGSVVTRQERGGEA